MSLFDSYPSLRQVIVNLKGGDSFRGVLWRKRRSYLVLRQAIMLRSEKPLPVDGEVLVFIPEISFMQVL